MMLKHLFFITGTISKSGYSPNLFMLFMKYLSINYKKSATKKILKHQMQKLSGACTFPVLLPVCEGDQYCPTGHGWISNWVLYCPAGLVLCECEWPGTYGGYKLDCGADHLSACLHSPYPKSGTNDCSMFTHCLMCNIGSSYSPPHPPCAMCSAGRVGSDCNTGK